MSVPGAESIEVTAVRQPRRRLPASSAPVSRSLQPRTGATIMLHMATRRGIMVVARSITVAGRPIPGAVTDRASHISTVIRTPDGTLQNLQTIIRGPLQAVDEFFMTIGLCGP